MPTEAFANNFAVQLGTGQLAADTVLKIGFAAPSYLVGVQFRVLVDGEYQLVTDASGVNWTVLRGAATGEFPTPVAVDHQQGTYATHIISGAALSNLPVPATVVDGSGLPISAGSIWKALGTSSAAAKPVPDVVVDAHRYCKGDGSQDELANLQAACAEVSARLTAVGGGTGAVDLGYGVYGVSGSLAPPSGVGLISHNNSGIWLQSAPSAKIEAISDFGDFIIKTPAGSQGCFLRGIQVFVPNTCSTVSGVQWNTDFGEIDHCSIRNSTLQGLVCNGNANVITHNFLNGGVPRLGTATTVSGAGQVFPTSTTLGLTSASGWPTSGYAQVAGVVGLIGYTGISGNTLTGCTGGFGTATNGGAATPFTYYHNTLTDFTGLGLHMSFGQEDNLVAWNEIAGDSQASLIMRTTNGWGCAAANFNGGITRFFGNIFETADTAFYMACPGNTNQIEYNRFEVANGHGVIFKVNTGYSNWVGNCYDSNGLAANDTYFHLNVGGTGVNNNFVAEEFYSHTNAFTGPNLPAAAICDFSQLVSNTYSALKIDDSSWVSAPWLAYSRSGADGAAVSIRAASERWRRFLSLPTSGNFTAGERFSVTPAQGGPTDYMVVGSYTQGTLSGVTATSVATTNQVTCGTGEGASVPLGSFITLAGVAFTPNTADSAGNQVLSRAGDVLTISGTASASVSGAAMGFQNSGATNLPRGIMYVPLLAAASITPGSITAGTQTTVATISVSGAALGNRATASYNKDLVGCELFAYVSATNTVSYFFRNGTGSTVTPAAGTITVWVTGT